MTTEANINDDETPPHITGGTMTSARLLECNASKMTTRGQKKRRTKSSLTMELCMLIFKMSVISEGVGGGEKKRIFALNRQRLCVTAR